MACSSSSTATSSEVEKKEQRLIDAMFLCDEWKSSKGGLSTFNRELAINLAETTSGSMRIHCYVSRSDDQDREDAEQHGVNLITAQTVPGSRDPLDWLKIPPPELPNPHIVIGHGRKLGTPACHIVRAARCTWIQFVHVFCEDLGKFKETTATAVTDTIEENEEKHKMEIELCKAADAVVAVGSRLQRKYSRSLPNVKVEIITPGIIEKFCNESVESGEHAGLLSSVLHAFTSYMFMKTFNVFMFGRATFEDLTLKGYDIVANAIGSLGEEFELTFVGSSPGEHRNIEQWFLQNTCIKRKQITIRGYCTEQDELKGMFHQSDLVALPSRTEGFGLVGLEAVSAGVPVLVSGESGIAEALQKVEGGKKVIVGLDESKDAWARRIREMYEESAEEREANAVKLRENYRKVYSWKAECEKFKGLIETVVENDQKLNIKVDVEHMKLADHDAYSTASVSALEPAGYQKASTASGTKRKRQCDTDLDNLQPLEKKVLCLIAMNYLDTTPPQSRDERNEFQKYLQEMKVLITGVSVGSLVITVKFDFLKSLEKLWEHYSCSHLDKMVQDCFVTEKILKELNLAELKLKTTMEVEEYKAYKLYFLGKDALRGVLSSGFHSTSSTSQSPQKQEELKKQKQKTKIVETEKVKGSSPPPLLSTTDLEEKIGKVCEDIKMLRMEDSFPVLKFSSIDLKKKLEELSMKLQRLRREGTLPPPELFTADLEEELKQLRTELIRQRMKGEELKRQGEKGEELKRQGEKGSSRPPVSTAEVELQELLEKLQKGRMEALENAMYPTIKSGLAKFDVSLPEELRSYVGYLFKESAKLGLRRQVLQSPRALEELREAMDKDELKSFLIIHIREGASQVVLLFLNELPTSKLPLEWYPRVRSHEVWDEDEDEDEDEEIRIPLYSSTSGILKAWLTEYDPGLVTLCKVIIKRDWKVTRLTLSSSRISDEGFKNLSTALTQSELYSLTLYGIGLQSQGLEHLCEALISSNCHLNCLNVSYNRLGDEGIMRLCNALTSVNCRLTSLNVSWSGLGDKGIVFLCNALTSVNCTLTSLNVSGNRLGDKGIMHLCNALTSVYCRLTSLNVSNIQLGDNGFKHLCDALISSNCVLTKLKVDRNGLGDGGLKELSEVLTNRFCSIRSLEICNNEFGDEGIMHLCKALTDTKCKLRSLDLHGNWNVTDEGEEYLSQMLTGTDWKIRGALRLSR